jgi:hypothetical protein
MSVPVPVLRNLAKLSLRTRTHQNTQNILQKTKPLPWRDFSSLEHSTSPSSLPASVTLHGYSDLVQGKGSLTDPYHHHHDLAIARKAFSLNNNLDKISNFSNINTRTNHPSTSYSCSAYVRGST